MTENLPDRGPMARLAELIAEDGAMGMIVQRLTDGETLREIAVSRQVPYGKLAEWITEDVGRAEQYARATRIWIDAEARETVGIADGAGDTKVGIAHAKLKVDTRLRLAGKLYREQYGEASQVSVQVRDERVLDHETLVLEAARMAAFLMGQAKIIEHDRGEKPALPAPALSTDTGLI